MTSTTTKIALGLTVAIVLVIGAFLASFLGILTVLAALSALPTSWRPRKVVAMERKSKQRTLDAVRQEARDQKLRERAREVEAERQKRQERNRAAWHEHEQFQQWLTLFSSPEACERFEAYCDAPMETSSK